MGPAAPRGAAQPPCWAGSPALGAFPCQPLHCRRVPAAAKAAPIHPTHPQASFPEPLLAARGSRGSASPTAPSPNNVTTAPIMPQQPQPLRPGSGRTQQPGPFLRPATLERLNDKNISIIHTQSPRAAPAALKQLKGWELPAGAPETPPLHHCHCRLRLPRPAGASPSKG